MIAPASDTALVLGGGGVTGIAWELAVIEELLRAGIDVTTADLIVGTSAGSSVAAQITSDTSIADLVAAQLTDPTLSKEIAVEFDFEAMIAIFTVMTDQSIDAQVRGTRVGEMALAADTVAESVRLEVIHARLPRTEWPDAQVILTAVDVHSGEFVTFDRRSGVALVDAVAASCAVPGVWPPVTIGTKRYMDGGVHSSTNAALATGYQRVLVLSPLSPAMTPSVQKEVAELRAAGAEVFLLDADEQSQAEMGLNPLDPAMRAPAVEAGRRQGRLATDAIGSLWG